MKKRRPLRRSKPRRGQRIRRFARARRFLEALSKHERAIYDGSWFKGGFE